MVDVRTLRESELDEYRRHLDAWLGREESLETVRSWYQEHPELMVGAFTDGELVGLCFGLPQSEDEVELAGIAVEQSSQRQDIGSKLIFSLEEQALSRRC